MRQNLPQGSNKILVMNNIEGINSYQVDFDFNSEA